MNKRLLSIALYGLLPLLSYSQSNGEVVTTYDPAANTVYNYTVFMQGNGNVLLAGDGNGYGPKRLLADGTLDATFNTAVQDFRYLLDDPSGIYAFGNGATRLGQNGSVNLPLANTIINWGINGTNFGNIEDIHQVEDGSIIAVGNFDYVNQYSGGYAANRIMRFQSDMVEYPGFRTNIGSGFNDYVYCVTVDTINDKIYCGGKFTSFNGNPVNGICRLNMDGTFDASFDAGTGFNVPTEYPKVMKMMNDGRIFISGQYITTYNGNARFQNVMLNNDGTLNTVFVPAVNVLGAIEDFYEISNDRMIAVGNNVQYVNSITASTTGLGSIFSMTNPGINGHQWSIQKVEDGIYLIGGQFTSINGTARNGSAKIYMCDQDPNLNLTFNNGVISSDFIGDSYVWTAWDPTDTYELTLTNNTNSTFTPTEPGAYYLNSTNGACQYEGYINLNQLSVSDIDKSGFTLYPNPTNHQVKISNIEQGATIEICDITGKKVMDLQATSTTLDIDLTSLNNGTYFVQVINQNNQKTIKRLNITK